MSLASVGMVLTYTHLSTEPHTYTQFKIVNLYLKKETGGHRGGGNIKTERMKDRTREKQIGSKGPTVEPESKDGQDKE